MSGDAAHRRIYVNPDGALPEGEVYIGVGDAHFDAQGNQGSAASATFTVDEDADTPRLSVSDAIVTEAAGAELAFTVRLDRAVESGHGTVSVDYATRDMTADAGVDYVAASGTLTFAVGEQQKVVKVRVLEDSHDDDGETLNLVLSNALGAIIADGFGRGVIRNSDPLPRAWLARFGRTVAEQIIEGVRERREAQRAPSELMATFGGQSLFGGSYGGRSFDCEGEAPSLTGACSGSEGMPGIEGGSPSVRGAWGGKASRLPRGRDALALGMAGGAFGGFPGREGVSPSNGGAFGGGSAGGGAFGSSGSFGGGAFGGSGSSDPFGGGGVRWARPVRRRRLRSERRRQPGIASPHRARRIC